MNGHAAWQFLSHNAYVIITIVGVLIVLALFYLGRKNVTGFYDKGKQGGETGTEDVDEGKKEKEK